MSTDFALSKPLTLKCGLVLPNRLTKAAMAESWADKDYLPHEQFRHVYEKWGKGDWGMIMTGNVMVDAAHRGQPSDIAVSSKNSSRILAAWRPWAATAGSTPMIMQINHPGRQSPMGAGERGLFARTIAPSAVPMSLGTGLMARFFRALLFGTPTEMTKAQIAEVAEKFATTARLASEAGFRGVEIHGAHGYLVSQFLTLESNRRTDEYGGSAANRARFAVEVIRAIRAATPEGFAVGIKLNSVDHQGGQLQECIEQLQLMVEAGVDFVEISGGSYEDPKMFQTSEAGEVVEKSGRTKAREAFFLDFARAVRSSLPETPLMVTGGFRSRRAMESAIANGDCELVGLGRPAVMKPTLPKDIILNAQIKEEDAKIVTTVKSASGDFLAFLGRAMGIKGLSAGAETIWYSARLQQLGKGTLL